jgi:hypothetical protein
MSSVIGVVESDVSIANVIDMFRKLTMKELCLDLPATSSRFTKFTLTFCALYCCFVA